MPIIAAKGNSASDENRKCFKLDCHDVALVVKFNAYEWSTNLLAIGTYTNILVMSCKLQHFWVSSIQFVVIYINWHELETRQDTTEEEKRRYQQNSNGQIVTQEEKGSLEGIQIESLTDFQHPSRVADISWSPATNINIVPRCVRVFSAGADRVVRCLTTDLKETKTIMTVGEHKDYVNAVASSPETGDSVASVSDDLTCCVWSITDEKPTRIACFPLTSPGMAICWHPLEPSKILVAEKKGVIRFYSVITQQAFLSLDCGRAPLISADWCYSNSLRVAVLADNDWFVFDTSRSSLPLETRQAHSSGGRSICWCHSHEFLLATTGRPGAQLKVFNMRSNQVALTVDMKVSSGLSWHSRMPVIVVGVDNQVHLWVIETL